MTDAELIARILAGDAAAGTMRQARARPMLEPIVRAQKDPQIRENAVFRIGQFDDPRAADALVEIISGQ